MRSGRTSNRIIPAEIAKEQGDWGIVSHGEVDWNHLSYGDRTPGHVDEIRCKGRGGDGADADGDGDETKHGYWCRGDWIDIPQRMREKE